MNGELEMWLGWLFNRMKNNPSFPHEDCTATTAEAERKYGFAHASGEFETDMPHPVTRSKRQVHCWSEDEERTIIDLCAYQFNGLMYRPVNEGVLIVRKGDEMHERYHCSKKIQNA